MKSLFAVVIGMALIEACFASSRDEAPLALEGFNCIETRNKKIVMDYILEFCGDKTIESMVKYLSPNLIEHNPLVADGIEGSKAFAQEWCKYLKKETVDIKRISAEGDLVWIHYKVNFMGKDVSVVDIFRFENGVVVEHWDVIQPIPDKSANNHPMF